MPPAIQTCCDSLKTDSGAKAERGGLAAGLAAALLPSPAPPPPSLPAKGLRLPQCARPECGSIWATDSRPQRGASVAGATGRGRGRRVVVRREAASPPRPVLPSLPPSLPWGDKAALLTPRHSQSRAEQPSKRAQRPAWRSHGELGVRGADLDPQQATNIPPDTALRAQGGGYPARAHLQDPFSHASSCESGNQGESALGMCRAPLRRGR